MGEGRGAVEDSEFASGIFSSLGGDSGWASRENSGTSPSLGFIFPERGVFRMSTEHAVDGARLRGCGLRAAPEGDAGDADGDAGDAAGDAAGEEISAAVKRGVLVTSTLVRGTVIATAADLSSVMV